MKYPSRSAGTPRSRRETSYAYFLSAIVEPPFIPGFSIEADFYRIEQRNLVSVPDPQDIVDGRLPGAVTYRDTGELQSVTALFANLGTVVVDGVDIALAYRLKSRVGTVTFDTRASFVNSYEVRQPFIGNEDRTDSFTRPEFRSVSSVFYGIGGFETGVTVNYTDSYDDQIGTAKSPVRKVGSWTTVDLQASYEWSYEKESVPAGLSKDDARSGSGAAFGLTNWQRLLDGTKLTLGVLNVGASEPPFSNRDVGYDAQTADALGRFVYVSLRKKFW